MYMFENMMLKVILVEQSNAISATQKTSLQ